MASLLAVATVFVGLLKSTFYSQRRGAYTRDKITYVGTEPKMQGGLILEVGRTCGIQGYYIATLEWTATSLLLSLDKDHDSSRSFLNKVAFLQCHKNTITAMGILFTTVTTTYLGHLC
jgi:hypothetical protein